MIFNILKYFRHQCRKIRAIAFVTYKEWSAYRSHSMVSIFVGPVYFLVQYCVWKAVYMAKGGTESVINGMSFNQMLTYFGTNALIGYLTMDFADWNLQMLVRTGKLLTFALRPIDHKLFAFSQKLGHRILGFTFEFNTVHKVKVRVFVKAFGRLTVCPRYVRLPTLLSCAPKLLFRKPLAERYDDFGFNAFYFVPGNIRLKRDIQPQYPLISVVKTRLTRAEFSLDKVNRLIAEDVLSRRHTAEVF